MGIFKSILSRKRLSPDAKKAAILCHRLFSHTALATIDLNALIDLDNAGIESFRLALSRDENNPDINRREQILDMLGSSKLNDQSSERKNATMIALLACFLDEQEGMLAAKAISYLAPYGAAVDDLLLNALQSNHCHCRSYAARALGQCHNSRAIPLLIAALDDADARVRSDAAESLGKLGDVQAVEALINALGDGNWLVRESAGAALADFKNNDLMNNNMMHKLIQLMQHEKHQMRVQALRIMNRMANKEILPLLISALDDAHIEVQQEAIDALGLYREAIVPLLAHYRQSDNALRQRIVSACEKIGTKRVASQLSNKNTDIRIAVTEILVELDCSALLPLLADAWQYETNPEVHTRIIIAMAQLTATAGKNSPDIAITTLIRAAESPNENMAYQARKALESLAHPLARQFMQPSLQNSKVAISCPSCLQALQLEPPLTTKAWSCPHCHLGFRIHHGADDILMVTPLTATVQGPALASHCKPWFEILQLNPDADVRAIKSSFRTLLKQYHPDKVATLGTEFKQLAEEKTRLLTWALRTGLKQRGS